jgi:hypothetical protein
MKENLSIRTDFSQFPGPRYRKDGPFSGQEFREDVLSLHLRAAIDGGYSLNVVIDDVAGYGSSFLEESFGGLLRHGFTAAEVAGHLRIVANTSRFQHHKQMALKYIEEQAQRMAAV